jgi:hypothetical protein
MPVQLTPDTTFSLTTEDIRAFMRDQPEYNILLDDVEFSNVDIQRAMRLTVAKWNALPPITNLTGPEFLNEWVLLCGVCCILLKSEGLRQKRNQLTVQDGNIANVGLDEKESLYLKWSMIFCDEFERLAQAAKIQQNMESILDDGRGRCGPSNGFGSGYRYIGRYTT